MDTELQPMMTTLTRVSSSFISEITPVILTFNEEQNIGRCLERLSVFSRVLVVDSYSTDNTHDIVNSFTNTILIVRKFDSFEGQWNFALMQDNIDTEWVLALDADYMITEKFIDELNSLSPNPDLDGFWIAFDYCVFGRKLTSTLYPPIIALYRRSKTHYIQDGHCQRAQVSGNIGKLLSKILHDDRKSLSRWLMTQAKYADQEAALLLSKPQTELRIQDRLRKLIFITPWLVPLYCLVVGRAICDGRAGWFYALQRGIAEAALSLKLLEVRFKLTTPDIR